MNTDDELTPEQDLYEIMLDCIRDKNGDVIEEAMRWDGSIYMSDGLWIRPNGDIYED